MKIIDNDGTVLLKTASWEKLVAGAIELWTAHSVALKPDERDALLLETWRIVNADLIEARRDPKWLCG
jgi:hypothetical protein